MARIGVAVVGAGFMGGVHAEALRRAGCEVVGVLGVSDAESTKFADATVGTRAYRSLDELLADPAVQSVHLGDAQQAALRDGEGRARGRQARAVREAAGHDLEGDGRAGRAGPQAPEAGRRRELQHPLLPALAGGPRARARRAAGRGLPRQRQLRAGLAAPRHRLQLARARGRGRRAARGGRHRHALAGPRPARSPAWRSRPSAPTCSTVHPVRQRPKGEVETFSGKLGNGRPTRAGADHDRGLRVPSCSASRAGRAARLSGLAGHGRPEELPALRDRRREGRLWPGTASARTSCGSAAAAGRTSC